MVDLTMLAPGPAGTSMIGESTIEAAARRGMAKRRQREQEMKFANEIPPKEANDTTEATEDKSQTQPQMSTPRTKSTIQAPSKSQTEESFNAISSEHSSELPVGENRHHGNGLREKWERLRRRLRG